MKELQNKSLEELNGMLAEARAEIYDMRLKTGVNQLRDVSKIGKKRKDIARMSMQISALKRESN
jgi:ribosomal protein L29